MFFRNFVKKHPNFHRFGSYRKLVELIKKFSNYRDGFDNSPVELAKVISNLVQFSERSDLPLMRRDYEQMLESILFGHEKGAFTRAIQSNKVY